MTELPQQTTVMYELPLQTPTIVLTISPVDSADNKNNFKAEFKRYFIAKAQEKLDSFTDILKDTDNTDSNSLLLQEQAIKQFVRDELVAFQEIRCFPVENSLKQLKIRLKRKMKKVLGVMHQTVLHSGLIYSGQVDPTVML